MFTNLTRKYDDQPFVTNGLLILLFVIFFIEQFLGGSQNTATLIKMGAQYNPLIVIAHQWWRLFTAQFLHIGFLHVASNAVMIYYMGNYLERLMGHWRFLALYLLSGIGGNLLSFAFGSDNAISAGASTALFGLFGAMIAIGASNRQLGLKNLAMQSLVLAVVNLILDLFVPSIDILGHLGGLISGVLLSLILGLPRRTYWVRLQLKWRILMSVILVIYFVFTVRQGMVIHY